MSRWWWGPVVLAACSAPPAPTKAPKWSESVPMVQLAIEFEPPLAEAGLLEIWHESGWFRRLYTRNSGVDLRLPPGPANLRLSAGGRVSHRVVKATGERTHLRWVFGQN